MKMPVFFRVIALLLFTTMVGTSRILAASYSAEYKAAKHPIIFSPGETATYSVSVTNTGTVTWPAHGITYMSVHFSTRPGGVAASGSWVTDQRLALPHTLAPGKKFTFLIRMQVPTTIGSYFLGYQMLINGVTWVPQPVDTLVAVAAPRLPSSSIGARCPGTQSGCIQAMLTIINRDRARYSLEPLVLNKTQSSRTATCVGSLGHSLAMQQSGSIWHTNARYPRASFPNNICVPYTSAGQNVGEARYGNEFTDLQKIEAMMMDEVHDTSTCATVLNHACNILSTRFHQIGIGIVNVNNITWLTEDFTS